MNCTTRVSSTVPLGGGIGSYVAYKVEVSFEGKSWAIFRRFKDFTALHERIQAQYTKEALEAAGVVLPEHTLGIGRTFSYIVTARTTALHTYLEKLFTLEKIETHAFVTMFLDVTNQGKSGAFKEIGAKGILLEVFGSCKPCTKVFEFWHSVYLVLTKAGTLYAFKNYDDGLFQAFINFPVAGRDVHVESRAGTRNIELISGDGSSPARVIISLSSDVEVASWLRAIADFSTRGASAFKPAKSTSFSQPSPAPQQQQQASMTPAIHAKGTGHTTDELSAMYGV